MQIIYNGHELTDDELEAVHQHWVRQAAIARPGRLQRAWWWVRVHLWRRI